MFQSALLCSIENHLVNSIQFNFSENFFPSKDKKLGRNKFEKKIQSFSAFYAFFFFFSFMKLGYFAVVVRDFNFF